MFQRVLKNLIFLIVASLFVNIGYSMEKKSEQDLLSHVMTKFTQSLKRLKNGLRRCA
jgi:hypothetical protein